MKITRCSSSIRQRDALACAEEVKLDLAILDIMMPEMDGLTLCQKIRDNHTFPIIMLTAKDSETDKITGLTYSKSNNTITVHIRHLREKYTRITLEKAYRLEKMINEFFEITRYSLQQIQLNKGTVDLCYMLVQLTDELLPVLTRNGNTTVIKMDNDDITVYGDREKLARVFNNILRNAAAYSYPNTEIVISAQERDGNVEIVFRNQGKTIPLEKQEAIFEKFYRMDDARNSDLNWMICSTILLAAFSGISALWRFSHRFGKRQFDLPRLQKC